MATYTDTFSRTNSSGLGANWTEGQGPTTTSTDFSINNNQLLLGTGTQASARWNAALDGDDHYCEIACSNLFANATLVLSVRGSETGLPLVSAYFQASAWNIYQVGAVTTDYTLRATGSWSRPSSGTYRFAVVGNVYTMYRNGNSIGSWTDTGNAHASGPARRWTGLAAAKSGGSGNLLLDNWETGDIVTEAEPDTSDTDFFKFF